MHKRVATHSSRGFTIIELLIVFVVIGVLALITTVTYNGILRRSRTTQTIHAAEQWTKGLVLYKARNGAYPNVSSCLGQDYAEAAPPAVAAQCSPGITAHPDFASMLSKYISGAPMPARSIAINGSAWRRGAYYRNTDPAVVGIVIEGAASDCPAKLTDHALTTSTQYGNGNSVCEYAIGQLTGY